MTNKKIKKTCNQCGKELKGWALCNECCFNVCHNPKCPNYSLLQISVEGMINLDAQ